MKTEVNTICKTKQILNNKRNKTNKAKLKGK